jgi:hypothetical protein
MYYPMLSLLIVAIAMLAVAVFLLRRRPKPQTATPLVQAKRRFHVQREGLEAKFLKLAAAQVKPEAPRWSDCSFADDVAYVRNRTTGELSAFVAVTLASADVSASAASTIDPLGNLQVGTAVFRFDRDHWVTDGRAILNLSPGEAVRYYRHDLEMVGEEIAHRA